MKTDVGIKLSENERAAGKAIDDQKTVRGLRRSLHPLQKEAGDKENLVGAGRLKDNMAPGKQRVSLALDTSSKTTKAPEKKGITVEDLTSEAGPSAAYWEKLAERRRVALEDALKENEELHQRVAFLTEENEQCKVLLEETRALVDTLTEILNSSEDQNEGGAQDSSEVE